MNLKNLAQIFNRSLAHCFGLKKFFCLFITLIVSTVIYLFFQAVSLYVTSWLQLLFKYIPFFLVIGLILSAGSILIRLYTQEREGESPVFFNTIRASLSLVIKSIYLSLPLLMAFLVFWILVSIFILLKSIPYLGTLLGIILAFAPFLLNFGVLMLFVIALLALFFYNTFFSNN